MASLVGADGSDGADSTVPGPQGPQGDPATWLGLSQNFYVDGTTGNDSTGNGSEALPYATIDAAIAAKNALTGVKIYNLGRGTYTSSTLASFPTNTVVKGQGQNATTLSITGAVALDNAWLNSSSSVYPVGSISDCVLTVASGMTIDFFGKTSLYGRFAFSRCTVNGALTYNGATAANVFTITQSAFLAAVGVAGPGVLVSLSEFYNTFTQNTSNSSYLGAAYVQYLTSSVFRSAVTINNASGQTAVIDARTSQFNSNVTISGASSALYASPTTITYTATITQTAGTLEWTATSKMQKFLASSSVADWTGQSANWNAFPVTVYAALTELAARVKALGG